MFLLPPQGQRGRGQWLLVAASAMLLCGLLFYTYRLYGAIEIERIIPQYSSSSKPHVAGIDMADIVPELWQPYIHDLNETTFTIPGGESFKIPEGAHHWRQPMGKKVLILDVDSRLDVGEGGLMNEGTINPKSMMGRTAGMLNHYLYALTHGYDYRFIRPADYPDRHGTWVKVPMIREALKTHDFVVFIDSDASIIHMDLPLEWLMSYWNVGPDINIAMAEDPDSESNRDEHGWVYWNTGFIIAQQSERTQEIFNAWDNCPSGKRWSDCGRWAKGWPHEQGAFGTHLRYDYNETLRAISALEANGAPYIPDQFKTKGKFIRHHWMHKENTINDLNDIILNMFMRRMHEQFHHDKTKYYLDATNFDFSGSSGLRV